MMKTNRGNRDINNSNLVNYLIQGHEDAYIYLMDTYYRELCVYAFGLIHDHDSAEDIVQNVLIKIWRKRKNLRHDSNIKNLLYRSVYNEFIDEYRKNKRILPLEKKHIEALSHFVENEDRASMEKLIALVKKEIQSLPPKCKQAFILSKQQGLSNAEIAEYMSISIKAVEAHMTKAFSILRSKINPKLEKILFILFGLESLDLEK